MKYLKTFESKVKYKNEEKYDWEFDYKINTPIIFKEDFLNGSPYPGLTKRIFIVQGRSDNIMKSQMKSQGGVSHNYYFLHDTDDYSFNWVKEEAIREATQEELDNNNDYQIWLIKQETGVDVDKYNL